MGCGASAHTSASAPARPQQTKRRHSSGSEVSEHELFDAHVDANVRLHEKIMQERRMSSSSLMLDSVTDHNGLLGHQSTRPSSAPGRAMEPTRSYGRLPPIVPTSQDNIDDSSGAQESPLQRLALAISKELLLDELKTPKEGPAALQDALRDTVSFDTSTGVQMVWPDAEDVKAKGKWHKARTDILWSAYRIGQAREIMDLPRRHVVLIYNPVSGGGRSKTMIDHIIVPVFRLARVNFTLVRTECRGFASSYIQSMDRSTVHCLAISGGDGLVQECITGIFSREDAHDFTEEVDVSIIATGTANAMAHMIHTGDGHVGAGHRRPSAVSIVGRTALATALGEVRRLDVIKAGMRSAPDMYAMSVFGWGACGAIAKKAARLRNSVPKKILYDVAGAMFVMKTWPYHVTAKFEYRKTPDSRWISLNDFTCTNFIASNIKVLGDVAMHSKVEPDDGQLGLVWASDTVTRMQLWRSRQRMKRGIPMEYCPSMHSIMVSEFKLSFAEKKGEFMIDGDPVEIDNVHVQVLRGRARTMVLSPLIGGSTRNTDVAAAQEQAKLVSASSVDASTQWEVHMIVRTLLGRCSQDIIARLASFLRKRVKSTASTSSNGHERGSPDRLPESLDEASANVRASMGMVLSVSRKKQGRLGRITRVPDGITVSNTSSLKSL